MGTKCVMYGYADWDNLVYDTLTTNNRLTHSLQHHSQAMAKPHDYDEFNIVDHKPKIDPEDVVLTPNCLYSSCF